MYSYIIKILMPISMLFTIGIASSQEVQYTNQLSLSDYSQEKQSQRSGVNLSCDTPTLYEQSLDVDNFSTARVSDVGNEVTVYENIVDSSGIITPFSSGVTSSIRAWGISLEFDPNTGPGIWVGSCSHDRDAGTQYNITFNTDNSGQPGAVIASVIADASVIDTAIPFDFTTIFEYDLSFTPTDLSGAAWVSIQRQEGANTDDGNPCLFLWVDESLVGSYDDTSFHEGLNNPAQGSDQTICIDSVEMEGPDLIFKNGFEN